MVDNTAAMERFWRDNQFYNDHYEELLEKYPEQWVVILDQKVVGTGPDLDALFKRLKAEGVSLAQVLVEFLSHDEPMLILSEVP